MVYKNKPVTIVSAIRGNDMIVVISRTKSCLSWTKPHTLARLFEASSPFKKQNRPPMLDLCSVKALQWTSNPPHPDLAGA